MIQTQDTLPAEHATGSVRVLLRLEAALVLTAALWLYGMAGASWWLFALCFFLPDVSLLAYLRGARVGAAVYNAAHSYAGVAVLAAAGVLMDSEGAQAAALIWVAHIGFDRLLGYGLKYATGFADTHLGTIGRQPAKASAIGLTPAARRDRAASQTMRKAKESL